MKILVVDDEPAIRKKLGAFLQKEGHKVLQTGDPREALSLFEESPVDVAILDVRLPGINGIALLRELRKGSPELEAIMITGHGDREHIVEALRAGAFDFFHKPFSLLDIKASIERTGRYLKVQQRASQAEKRVSVLSAEMERRVGDIIAKSAQMKQVVQLAQRAAQFPSSAVLITGPTGSGKELVARLVHHASTRADDVFYAFNCSAIPESLAESILFGSEKGAYTGAERRQTGVFEAADGGTLFLDEIGDMPLAVQSKVLRAIEEKVFSRLGSEITIPVDVRIVAATNQNLPRLIATGGFREDLFYRLNAIEIHVPPLRERPADVGPLFEHFVQGMCRSNGMRVKLVSPAVAGALAAYTFPGNVRELRNLAERAVVLSPGDEITPEHLPISSANSFSERQGESVPFDVNLERMEKRLVAEAMRRAEGNKSEAARLLGISRQALDRRLERSKRAPRP